MSFVKDDPILAAREGIIDGYLDSFYVNQIRNLRKIVPETIKVNEQNVRSVKLYDNRTPIYDFTQF
jgi:hypothetical protein